MIGEIDSVSSPPPSAKPKPRPLLSTIQVGPKDGSQKLPWQMTGSWRSAPALISIEHPTVGRPPCHRIPHPGTGT